MLEPLRDRVFRRLFAAQVVALAGTGLTTVALGLLAYDLAGDRAGAVLGTALAIKMVAYVAVAPVVEVWARRVPRPVLMVGSDVLRAGTVLLLPFVGQVWHVYALIFVLQAGSATFTPAFQAVIPTVLRSEERYTRGLSLSRFAYDLEALASPVVAAALLTVLSYDSLFLGTAAGFAASAVLVLSARLPAAPSGDRPAGAGGRRRIWSGSATMMRRPALRAVLARNMVVAAGSSLVLVNTVVYVRDRMGGSETMVALLLACFGGGSMAVALAIPRVLRVRSDRGVMAVGAAVVPIVLCGTAGLLALGIGSTVAAAALGLVWIALGAATSAIVTPTPRILRREVDPAEWPSVFAAQFSLSHACFLVTYPVAGWVGAADQSVAAVLLAVLATLAAVTAARARGETGDEKRDGVAAGDGSCSGGEGGEPGPSGRAGSRTPRRRDRDVPHAGGPDAPAHSLATHPGGGGRHGLDRGLGSIAHRGQSAPGETAAHGTGGHAQGGSAGDLPDP
ncbi:Predicted arabinose efflux permease, MFS family [Rhodococcus triatomae]|uniref:Predicted arabinose efflux permease, MFS family n=1 Tax=Rhodococcus triatomae TaxID=300028 RepID=A0A1G8DUD0_9NOCA|nr:Predicted arabinose efflux permease, MFS family [Rhodococcus triatomae]